VLYPEILRGSPLDTVRLNVCKSLIRSDQVGSSQGRPPGVSPGALVGRPAHTGHRQPLGAMQNTLRNRLQLGSGGNRSRLNLLKGVESHGAGGCPIGAVED
jgi:hypothetical protein